MFFARFFSSLLPILAVLLAFTASIFFHELGHFIAAKIRKLEVPIFSFGFGPRLFSLHIGGSEFRLSLFPLGGFVSIPQLSPPKNPEDPSNLPPSTRIFSDKVFIALMGPIFNFIFAFFLALALFFYGVNFPPSFTHNSIGFVHPEITLDNGNTSPSPAYLAGLQTGDQICSIDGTPTSNFFDIIHGITLGKNRDQLGPISSISVLRNGQSLEFSVHPVLLKQSPQGHDAFRTIGIEPYQELIVAHVFDTSPAHCVGLKRGDQLLALDGHKIFSLSHLLKMLEQRDHGTLSIQRSGENIDLPIHAKKIPATLPIIRFTTDHGPFELVPVFDRRDRIEDPLLDR
ncbi:MAG: site-2 protease family protein, partial [Puniceicoccales bacterium]|nr:site-2 protease family protein [Puniceicoccales bacterium]